MEETDMDKIPVIPADPMEAAHMPIKGVDVPEDDTAQREDETTDRKHPEYQRAFAENEGLVKPNTRAADDIERPQEEKLGATAEAAQRGRTA
jgi:hypothetical protein